MTILWVALGGMIGAVCRHLLGNLVVYFGKEALLGTLVANIIASFIAGLILALIMDGMLSEKYRLLILVGFAGSLSTMSALSIELVAMVEMARYLTAFGYMLVNVGLSFAAALLGYYLSRLTGSA